MIIAREIWYTTGWESNTAEAFAELKRTSGNATTSSFAADRWNDPTGQPIPWMTAVYGDVDADLPEGYVTINTDNHSFSVSEPWMESGRASRTAFFHRTDGGHLRLTQVEGPVSGFRDPGEYLQALIQEDAMVRSTSRQAFVRDSTRIVEFSPWPGLDLAAPWLQVKYPKMDSYDELIASAKTAFEFFLSGLDPRTN